MSGAHAVIELLSSSDEASSSDVEPRGVAQESSNSSEEEKAPRPSKRRPPVRSSHGVRVANGRRRKRVLSVESESSQESESGQEERAIVQQLKPRAAAPKKPKLAATKAYVAPAARARPNRRADGEMRQITEGMSFYELQAQQQLMARFQAQNRRKAPVKPRGEEISERTKPTFVTGSASSDAAAKRALQMAEQMSADAMKTKAQYHTQKVRKSVSNVYKSESGSEEDDEREEKDEDWDEFTKKSAQRDMLRKQKQHEAAKATHAVQRNREPQKSPVFRTNSGKHIQKPAQLAARKSAVNKSAQQKVTKARVAMAQKSKRLILTARSSSSREEESEAEGGVESGLENELESEERSSGEEESGEPEQLVRRRNNKSRPLKKKMGTSSSKPSVPNGSSKTKATESPPAVNVNAGTAQVGSRAIHHGVNEMQMIAEKMSFEELQAQERALSFFHAQKRRHASESSSTLNKTSHDARKDNGAHGTARVYKTNGARRARMGVSQEETPQTSSSLSFVAPPSRSGFLSSSAQSISSAKCTATAEESHKNPVIHTTAWRRLVFDEAPSNILEAVPMIPYAAGSDKPLWDYDPTRKLKEKCKLVTSGVGQGVVITEENFSLQLSQKDIDSQVREMVELELPYVKECHARRVKHIMRDTRKQVAAYTKARQILRGDLVRRLQWSEIANHQSWLDISPIERVAAKRVLQTPTHTIQQYNYLVGNVRYFVHRDQTPLESLVYPETVIHLPNDITPIRRSFTMIGIRKNNFVEDDPILRYVPYLGDKERFVVENDLYTETTMSKERQMAVIGEGEDLKVAKPSARDDEIMEYLLRIIVGKCGPSEQVFLALQHETGFDRPRIDYCDLQALNRAERIASKRIAKVKELIRPNQASSANQTISSMALRQLAQSCWFLEGPCEPQSLAVRLQPPISVFESCYARAPEGLGLRDRSTYDGLIEWHRDLFCRRCYSYDCSEHGIQNPQRSHRADPIYPMVTVPGVALARQELPIENDDLGAGDGSPNTSTPKVIELTGSSSSEDDTEAKKNQESHVAQPEPGYRRSRRAQTRISSLATKSLEIQEKLQESERLAELEKRKKRREKFARAADNSEYLDNSYLPAVTTTLKKLLSKTQPCSSSCWLSVGDKIPSDNCAPLSSGVNLVLVRKLASSIGPHPCVISGLLQSPRCTCTEISRVFAEEKKRRDSGDNLGADTDPLASTERRQKPRRHNPGVGGNRSMANRARKQRNYDREQTMSYKPCNHGPGGVCDERCDCKMRGHSCNKTCSCPRDCPNRFQGCKCSIGNCRTSACPCWDCGRECDPDYCFTCGSSDAAVMAFHPEFKSRGSYDLNVCMNVDLLRGSIQKKVGIAFSATHGWGAYALEPIHKDEFVLEYTGELITDEEAERRGAIYDRKRVSYLFGVNSEYVVDAARKGNKAKFANHKAKGEANLDVRIILSNGEHRIGLFARETIEVGAELFFDYGYTHDAAPKWSQHGRPQPTHKRAYDIVDDENEWEQWE